MNIDIKDCRTPAQAATKIFYNEETRSLDFRVKCENLEDMKKCVKTIEAYNAFEHEKVNEALQRVLGLKKYYNPDNPNNGGDFFEFTIGREGSPAMYVSYYKGTYGAKYIDESGDIKEMTDDEFDRLLKSFKTLSEADELNTYDEYGNRVARLWWD